MRSPVNAGMTALRASSASSTSARLGAGGSGATGMCAVDSRERCRSCRSVSRGSKRNRTLPRFKRYSEAQSRALRVAPKLSRYSTRELIPALNTSRPSGRWRKPKPNARTVGSTRTPVGADSAWPCATGISGTSTPTVPTRFGVQTPPVTTTAPASTNPRLGSPPPPAAPARLDEPSAGLHAAHAPVALGDPQRERVRERRRAASFRARGERPRGLGRVALTVVGAPHRGGKGSRRVRDHLPCIARIQQAHLREPGAVRLRDECAQGRKLGRVVAEVDVAAEAQFAVSLVAQLPPELDRLPGDRELSSVPTLQPQGSLGAPGALARRSRLLLDEHDARPAPRGACSGGVAG